ncbi:MAG TPA: hypothetical protein GXZ90_07460, partial [Clostridiales bacterium]|nr:hypothetical protein [Clostridiales bacterium]
MPQIDTIREVLKRIDLSGLEAFTSSIVNKAKENKVFRNGTIDGYTVAKRLLEKVRQTYNSMVDIVVYDALACNSIWINHCFVHHTNAIEAILHLMITANNIMQLFVHRRLAGKAVKEMPEKELIRLI